MILVKSLSAVVSDLQKLEKHGRCNTRPYYCIVHATERVTMTSLRPRNLEQVARPSLVHTEEGVVWGRDYQGLCAQHKLK